MKTPLFVRLIPFFSIALAGRTAVATGYFGPMVYLDNGGSKVRASPEFYWELEVKRLARDFHPPEKFSAPPTDDSQPNDDRRELLNRSTVTADLADFADALKTGRIKPPDPEKAKRQEQAARDFLAHADPKTTEPLPEEFPSEFADYHRGALAYLRGAENWAEARDAWEALLKRPEAERHYRSVWATFMLGKLALKEKDPAAVSWFQRTRELARVGFADSLGMAADSYGWEARSEWKQGHPEKAAPLYLTQLSLGDESAIVSLKALIPDREPMEGMLNYDPIPKDATLPELKRAAQDPLLRRLVTVHILATASLPAEFTSYGNTTPNRCARWLAILDDLKLDQLEDAEYIAWVAYNNGEYKAAERWLKLAARDSPAALWLRAKLQSRAGNLTEAAQSMARAWQIVRDPHAYTGWGTESEQPERNPWDESHWTFPESAAGDFGALHLERSDFVQALDTLLAGGLWIDAAFVAERVLTMAELQKYIDAHPPNEKADASGSLAQLRYLLGRRLVREDQAGKARAYLPPPYDQVLDRYLATLHEGRDKSRAKIDRARALFRAAWLARHDGMELMGTEGAPDGFATGGAFPVPDLAAQFRSGHYEAFDYSGAETKQHEEPVALRVPPREHRRLTKNRTVPDLRFHYRIIAGTLAVQAAELLPNDSEELGDVLNCAGLWVKERDEKLADRYYQILQARAAKTGLGQATRAQRWFVDQTGPWSAEEEKIEAKMRADLHLPDEGAR